MHTHSERERYMHIYIMSKEIVLSPFQEWAQREGRDEDLGLENEIA